MLSRRLALCVCLVLAGCGTGEFDDLKQFVEKSSEGMRGRVEPLPQMKAVQEIKYDAFDLPNPFQPHSTAGAKPPTDCKACQEAERHRLRPKEALEGYPLESLKMVGTLERSQKRWALIKTPENSLYKITAGNHLGQNFGEVKAITESQVTVKELVEDANGSWAERETALQLIEEEGKK